jgi:hypothetical protein
MGWLNEAAAKYGGRQVCCARFLRDPGTDDIHPGRWITEIVCRLLLLFVDMGTTHALNSADEVAHYWHIGFYGGELQLKGEKDEAVLASLGIIPRNGADQGGYAAVALFYDDNW